MLFPKKINLEKVNFPKSSTLITRDGDVDGGAQLEGGDEKQTNKKSEMHFNPKDLQQSCRGEQL